MSQISAAQVLAQAIILGSFNADELRDISTALLIAKSKLAVTVKSELCYGSKVSFNSTKLGGLIKGTVIKVNPKKVRVQTEKNGLWNVPAAMLTVLE